jgi:hypothetical protein
MNKSQDYLSTMGFQTYNVRNKTLETYLPQRQRGGIYVLHMADDTLYVGQAIDVVKRYAQHYQNYSNIEYVSFKPIDKVNFDTEEIRFIHALEQRGFRLLNILHTSVTYHPTDFDLLVPVDQQKRWFDDPTWVYPGEERNNEGKEEQRIKTQQKFEKLRRDPKFQPLVSLLKHYVHYTIPSFRTTQFEYWSITCLPSIFNHERYTTMNMNAMETFVVGKGGWSFINIALSVFEKGYQNDQDFLRKYPGVNIRNSHYKAAGFDQLALNMDTLEQATQVLRDPIVIKAARLLNLQLMRKRKCFYRRYHCFDLADMLVS